MDTFYLEKIGFSPLFGGGGLQLKFGDDTYISIENGKFYLYGYDCPNSDYAVPIYPKSKEDLDSLINILKE